MRDDEPVVREVANKINKVDGRRRIEDGKYETGRLIAMLKPIACLPR